MHIAVYLPLLFCLFAPLGARPLAERCEPRLATWLLTASSLVLGTASIISLGLLAVTGLIRIPQLASLGHWSAHTAQHDDPVQLSIALVAGLLLGGAVLMAARMLWHRARSLAAATLDAACMPARDGLVVVDDEVPDAFALPGLPGLVVVSTGMLHTLDETEHDILLAHERAHLSAHHYAFVALAQLGAAANPCCAPSPQLSPTPSNAGPTRARPLPPATEGVWPAPSAKPPLPRTAHPHWCGPAAPPSASSAAGARSRPPARFPAESPPCSPRLWGSPRHLPPRPQPS
ncbi:M48 family metalloprotease [Streptomyces chiangmaiensis]